MSFLTQIISNAIIILLPIVSRPWKKLLVLDWIEVSNSLCNMWVCIILLKIAPGMP